MEGWFPHDRGERNCLRIAEAVERAPQLADAIQRTLPSEPAAKSLLTSRTEANVARRNALPTAGVDAGRNTVPVFGEVSLDILLHGSPHSRNVPRWPTIRAGREEPLR